MEDQKPKDQKPSFTTKMLSKLTRHVMVKSLRRTADRLDKTPDLCGVSFKIDANIKRIQADIIEAWPDDTPLPDLWGQSPKDKA